MFSRKASFENTCQDGVHFKFPFRFF
jgi:hypothetical protein